MSLKNEIDKMSQNNKNINQIKNNLNNVIVQNGGSTSKSLAEIPNNLESMINQRKRIAIIDVNNKALNTEDWYVDTIVNYNINFNPKYAYVHLENNGGSQASVTSSFITSQNKPNFFNGQNSYIKEVSKNRIVISAQRYNGIFVSYIKKIVLIE